MTWAIFLVCISYFIFVLPITLLNVMDHKVEFPASHVIAFCVYWSQYSLNCFVYAIRSDQYRKAFVSLVLVVHDNFRMLFCSAGRCCKQQEITNTEAFLYIRRTALPKPLNNISLERIGNKYLVREDLYQSSPSLSQSGNLRHIVIYISSSIFLNSRYYSNKTLKLF